MRLLTWNICRGGGKRIDRIASSLKSHGPDVVVSTEFRSNPAGGRLRSRLSEEGLVHQAASNESSAVDGVLVASTLPLRVCAQRQGQLAYQAQWLCVQLEDLDLVCVYLNPHCPGKRFGQKKEEFRLYWKTVVQLARERRRKSSILIGDFNTGNGVMDAEGAAFYGYEHVEELFELGFIDAWRHHHPEAREYTWLSPKGNGFRLDYVFLSFELQSRLLDVHHSHEERELGISDHSMLIAEIGDP